MLTPWMVGKERLSLHFNLVHPKEYVLTLTLILKLYSFHRKIEAMFQIFLPILSTI